MFAIESWIVTAFIFTALLSYAMGFRHGLRSFCVSSIGHRGYTPPNAGKIIPPQGGSAIAPPKG